jgi:hypothetical protein
VEGRHFHKGNRRFRGDPGVARIGGNDVIFPEHRIDPFFGARDDHHPEPRPGQEGKIPHQIGKARVLGNREIDLKNHGGALKTALIMKRFPDKVHLGPRRTGVFHDPTIIQGRENVKSDIILCIDHWKK